MRTSSRATPSDGDEEDLQLILGSSGRHRERVIRKPTVLAAIYGTGGTVTVHAEKKRLVDNREASRSARTTASGMPDIV